MTPEERQLEDARLMSIMAPFEAEDIYNADEVSNLLKKISKLKMKLKKFL